MRLTNIKRPNRYAQLIAERDGMVLYNAYEKDELIYPNMVRPANKFWEEY